MADAEQVARAFHEAYERLAPDFGYKTREASAVPWEDVPANNKALMIAVVAALRDAGLLLPQGCFAVNEQVYCRTHMKRKTGTPPRCWTCRYLARQTDGHSHDYHDVPGPVGGMWRSECWCGVSAPAPVDRGTENG